MIIDSLLHGQPSSTNRVAFLQWADLSSRLTSPIGQRNFHRCTKVHGQCGNLKKFRFKQSLVKASLMINHRNQEQFLLMWWRVWKKSFQIYHHPLYMEGDDLCTCQALCQKKHAELVWIWRLWVVDEVVLKVAIQNIELYTIMYVYIFIVFYIFLIFLNVHLFLSYVSLFFYFSLQCGTNSAYWSCTPALFAKSIQLVVFLISTNIPVLNLPLLMYENVRSGSSPGPTNDPDLWSRPPIQTFPRELIQTFDPDLWNDIIYGRVDVCSSSPCQAAKQQTVLKPRCQAVKLLSCTCSKATLLSSQAVKQPSCTCC